VMASARNLKFKWNRGEEFSTQLWMLNDQFQSVEHGVVRATLMSGKKVIELGEWEFKKAGSNRNVEGPVLKTILPHWETDGFTLYLDVIGHPEYNSSYTFLLSD
jgi:beta-mannosidase